MKSTYQSLTIRFAQLMHDQKLINHKEYKEICAKAKNIPVTLDNEARVYLDEIVNKQQQLNQLANTKAKLTQALAAREYNAAYKPLIP